MFETLWADFPRKRKLNLGLHGDSLTETNSADARGSGDGRLHVALRKELYKTLYPHYQVNTITNYAIYGTEVGDENTPQPGLARVYEMAGSIKRRPDGVNLDIVAYCYNDLDTDPVTSIVAQAEQYGSDVLARSPNQETHLVFAAVFPAEIVAHDDAITEFNTIMRKAITERRSVYKAYIDTRDIPQFSDRSKIGGPGWHYDRIHQDADGVKLYQAPFWAKRIKTILLGPEFFEKVFIPKLAQVNLFYADKVTGEPNTVNGYENQGGNDAIASESIGYQMLSAVRNGDKAAFDAFNNFAKAHFERTETNFLANPPTSGYPLIANGQPGDFRYDRLMTRDYNPVTGNANKQETAADADLDRLEALMMGYALWGDTVYRTDILEIGRDFLDSCFDTIDGKIYYPDAAVHNVASWNNPDTISNAPSYYKPDQFRDLLVFFKAENDPQDATRIADLETFIGSHLYDRIEEFNELNESGWYTQTVYAYRENNHSDPGEAHLRQPANTLINKADYPTNFLGNQEFQGLNPESSRTITACLRSYAKYKDERALTIAKRMLTKLVEDVEATLPDYHAFYGPDSEGQAVFDSIPQTRLLYIIAKMVLDPLNTNFDTFDAIAGSGNGSNDVFRDWIGSLGSVQVPVPTGRVVGAQVYWLFIIIDLMEAADSYVRVAMEVN